MLSEKRIMEGLKDIQESSEVSTEWEAMHTRELVEQVLLWVLGEENPTDKGDLFS